MMTATAGIVAPRARGHLQQRDEEATRGASIRAPHCPKASGGVRTRGDQYGPVRRHGPAPSACGELDGMKHERDDAVMWREIGKTLRDAMHSWGAAFRLCVCLIVVAACLIALAWAGVLR